MRFSAFKNRYEVDPFSLSRRLETKGQFSEKNEKTEKPMFK